LGKKRGETMEKGKGKGSTLLTTPGETAEKGRGRHEKKKNYGGYGGKRKKMKTAAHCPVLSKDAWGGRKDTVQVVRGKKNSAHHTPSEQKGQGERKKGAFIKRATGRGKKKGARTLPRITVQPAT